MSGSGCMHCGRPIVGRVVMHIEGPYHPACNAVASRPAGEDALVSEVRRLRAELAGYRNALQPLRLHVDSFAETDLKEWYRRGGRWVLKLADALGWK